MSRFVIFNDDEMQNILIADSKEFLESIYDLQIIEIDEETYMSNINTSWKMYNSEFRPEQPFASWSWDNELKKWISPVEIPIDSNEYVWNEENLNWDLVTE